MNPKKHPQDQQRPRPTPSKPTETIRKDYNEKAIQAGNEDQREFKQTSQLLKFNNWIKSVLISHYSKEMYKKLQNFYDIKKGDRKPLLHILDVGCGRGQDIKKWKLARVRYMVANDFSEECIKVYQERWRGSGEPFKLYTVSADFTKFQLYGKIQHAFYDIVSAQLCFHYMFQTNIGLNYGLASMLSNLLVGGVFIATIPDSYTILRKINEKGQYRNGYTYYQNKYFSLRFEKTKFTQLCGNQYGFYLQQAVGSKNQQTGQIQYTTQWLISLDKLEQMLKKFGVQIEYTKNFLQFYLQHRDQQQYKQIFSKIKLSFAQGQSMNPDLWQIAHLYRVLVCRKKGGGKTLQQYSLDDRIKCTQGKQIPRNFMDSDRGRSRGYYGNSGGHRGNSHNSYNNNNNSRYSSRGKSNNYYNSNHNSRGKYDKH